ncbi:hypothetical protein OSTOST_16386 [Ostertagia ostertagi]
MFPNKDPVHPPEGHIPICDLFHGCAGNGHLFTVDIAMLQLFAYVIKVGARHDRFRRRELRCCVQFLIMFLTYTVTWLTFFLYPAIGIEAPEAYVVTTVVFMINCGINSIIYLTLNKEVPTANIWKKN